jgi:hypothetical protein
LNPNRREVLLLAATYGVDALGVDPKGYTSNDRDVPAGTGKAPGEFVGGVETPHASCLALPFAPPDGAIEAAIRPLIASEEFAAGSPSRNDAGSEGSPESL